MKDRERELLRALLKSARKGRFNKILKFLLLVLFFYSSFLAGRELFNYYVTEKEKLTFNLKGLKWKFDWHQGKLQVGFRELELSSSGKFSLSVEDGDFELLLYKSFLEFKPFFAKVWVGRVVYESSG